jgi:hypothetical protein
LEGRLKYKCIACDYLTHLKPDMEKHYNSKHEPNPVVHQCPDCPYLSTRLDTLRVHVARRHANSILL